MNLPRLQKLANCASLGEWQASKPGDYSDRGSVITGGEIGELRIAVANTKEDAKYIAEASPKNILELIADRDRLGEKAEQMEDTAKENHELAMDYSRQLGDTSSQLSAANQQISELRETLGELITQVQKYIISVDEDAPIELADAKIAALAALTPKEGA